MPVGEWQSWLIPLSGTPLRGKECCAEKGTTRSARGGSILFAIAGIPESSFKRALLPLARCGDSLR